MAQSWPSVVHLYLFKTLDWLSPVKSGIIIHHTSENIQENWGQYDWLIK